MVKLFRGISRNGYVIPIPASQQNVMGISFVQVNILPEWLMIFLDLFCSNRDLSMILDALLKTKSRTVLFDIINKNGNYVSVLMPEHACTISQLFQGFVA